MNVQTDRYNWSVPLPLDSAYALTLLVAACALLLAAGYYSGVHREALSPSPIRSFVAVISAAAHRGEGTFWVVWGLIGVAAVLAFTSGIIFVGLLAFAS